MNNIIIHIAGAQGSGKTTMGNKLLKKYKNKIYVKDLDELHAENKSNDYQQFINEFIKLHNDKPLIFVGLDAELCLGTMEDSDVMYDLHTNYKFYIITSINVLKQRFFRQIDKLVNRKEWFFDQYLKNPDFIQNKLFRFVDLNAWVTNNEKCDELYIKRDYKFLDYDSIYKNVCKIIAKNIVE